MQEPSIPLPPDAIDPATLLELDLIALKRGTTIEHVIAEALDRYVLAETGQLN